MMLQWGVMALSWGCDPRVGGGGELATMQAVIHMELLSSY